MSRRPIIMISNGVTKSIGIQKFFFLLPRVGAGRGVVTRGLLARFIKLFSHSAPSLSVILAWSRVFHFFKKGSIRSPKTPSVPHRVAPWPSPYVSPERRNVATMSVNFLNRRSPTFCVVRRSGWGRLPGCDVFPEFSGEGWWDRNRLEKFFRSRSRWSRAACNMPCLALASRRSRLRKAR